MKTKLEDIFWVVYVSAILALSMHVASSLAFGAELKYTFATVDITYPGHPEANVFPVDINDGGTMVLRTWIRNDLGNAVIGALIARPHNARSNKIQFNRAIPFSCGAVTEPESINNFEQVVGNCDQGAFIRNPSGNYLILNNGPNTWASSISDDQFVSGSYSTLFPQGGGIDHGLSWHPLIGYQTIDFPFDPLAYPIRLQRLLGRDRAGQTIGLYDVRRLDNGIYWPEASYFRYDNGSFTVDFPSLFNDFTDRAYTFYDINDSGQMIGARYDGSIFLYDDGVFYDVKLPIGWLFGGLGGLNNHGEFVGTYKKQVGVNQFGPIFEFHGFVATKGRGR